MPTAFRSLRARESCVAGLAALALVSASAPPPRTAPATQALTGIQSAGRGSDAKTPAPKPVRFAIIGDYGVQTPDEAAVANLVKSFQPDFVITVGDNNYPLGEASTIDANIGQYYHEFIYPYTGAYGPGAVANRFFPALGNHDWETTSASAYLAYFTLPGNERYYDFVRGPVHFFAIDSDAREPDGTSSSSVQAAWLQSKLSLSTAPFQFVYFHHSPYSSAEHDDNLSLQWPFRDWGADAVFTGHDHAYERIVRDGFPYIVNGLGGQGIYGFGTPVGGSKLRYNADFGAMLVEATSRAATLHFITSSGIEIDTFSITPAGADFQETDLCALASTWRYLDNGSNQGTAWRATGFNDSSWPQGTAEFGYGDGDEATVVSYGPNAFNKYVTTYFRKSFQVVNPTVIRGLTLELRRDDGALVYLNGTEVFRANMPATTIAYNTLAASEVPEAYEDGLFGADIPVSLLVAGTNVLAVEIHQRSVTGSDLSFDAQLKATLEDDVLSPKGSVWKYLDTGDFQGGTWIQPGFDDASWSSGPAQLGYGDGDESTVVGFGPNPNAKYITTWFRRTFTVTDSSQYRALLLKILYDDGTRVFLNGHEVLRTNLLHGSLLPTDVAALAVGGADESVYLETFIDPAILVDGANTLAVEVHQSSGTSSDLSFDLELVGL